MIKTVIFDFDGTLSNTIYSIQYFANKTLEKYGLKTADTASFKKFVGDGAKKLVMRLLENAGENPEGELLQKVLKEYNESYDKNPLYLVRPYDGICDMLNDLCKMGVKTAIISNKPHDTVCKIAAAVFDGFDFAAVYGQRKGIPVKPDPTAVNMIMDELGVSPDECIYVGDTSTDMQTGINAGIYKIGVLWGFRDRNDLRAADAVIDDPSEITEIVRRINRV